MKLSRFALILVLSATGYAQQATPTSATQNVTSPTAASQTGGTVIFYREGHFTGSALKPSIFLDGREVARLKNGTYFMTQVEPGKHEAGSSAKHEPPLTIDVKPGETTYIQMIVVSGTWRGAGRLIPVPADDGKGAVSKLHLLD
ncbi:MAG TPA: DUF2846 domain-containing protein [Terriglobales bacterium]|jgi:hypothetical protein|nr:DUF2846 domain-containing protein [Terriglobales bacterium]